MAFEETEVRPRENTIELVSEEEATGRVDDVYREIRAEREDELDEELSLSKMWLMFGHDAGLLEALWHHMDQMYNGGVVPFELKSEISLVVASVLECEGCRYFHESALKKLDLDEAKIAAMEDLEIEEVGFSPTEEVILLFAQKSAEDPHSVTDEDLEALRDIGLTEREILEVLDCIALHVYTAYIQAIAGIVYPGMSREEWTAPL